MRHEYCSTQWVADWGTSRCVALARAPRRTQDEGRSALQLFLLTNCRLAQTDLGQAELAGIDLRFIDDSARDVRQTREAVVDVVEDVRPNVLIVDTFPRGLGGELCSFLADTNAIRVFTHRDLNP